MFDQNVPEIGLIGLASWDRVLVVDGYPDAGSWAYVSQELSLPGGTTTNTATALAKLGANARLRAVIGDDDQGSQLLASLRESGVLVEDVTIRMGERTDASTVIVSTTPPDRTIYWIVGAALRKGDAIDIDTYFSMDVLILDIADAPLRRFLTDLPAHTVPGVRMLGTLTYLAGSGEADELEVALRFDTLVGNERQFCELTGETHAKHALQRVQQLMPGNNLRAAVMTCGSRGCVIATTAEMLDVPAFEVVALDTTGAGDAFAAGIAWGMARRWDWYRTGTFANAVGALSTRTVGAQTSLPNMTEVEQLISQRTLDP